MGMAFVAALDPTAALVSTFSVFGRSVRNPKEAFRAVFADTSDEGLAKAFAEVDADSSGTIEADELGRYVKRKYGGSVNDVAIMEMIKAADTTGDSQITFDEFKAIVLQAA